MVNCSLKKNKKLEMCKRRPKPLLPYFGGKQRVADEIISKFPEHKIYVEPFAGGASVFWKNTVPDKFVINDLNKDVCTVYKVAKSNPGNLKKCNLTNMNKEKFNKLKNKSNKTACEVIKLHKHGYGGLPQHYADKGGRKFNNAMNEKNIEKMKKTKVLCEDYKKVMEKHDSKDTLFYLDPPYVKAGGAYITHGVTPKEVCEVAKKMKGKVVISYDKNKEVRKACKGMKFRNLKIPYTASKNKRKGEEYLITNY